MFFYLIFLKIEYGVNSLFKRKKEKKNCINNKSFHFLVRKINKQTTKHKKKKDFILISTLFKNSKNLLNSKNMLQFVIDYQA